MSKKKQKTPTGLVTNPSMFRAILEARKNNEQNLTNPQPRNVIPSPKFKPLEEAIEQSRTHSEKAKIKEQSVTKLKARVSLLNTTGQKKYDTLLSLILKDYENGLEIEKIIAKYKGRMEELKAIDKNINENRLPFNKPITVGFYKNLLMALVKKDIKFGLYCDMQSLAQCRALVLSNIKDEAIRKEIFNRMGGVNMPNRDLFERYFPELIPYITNFDKYAHALAIAPEYYNLTNAEIKKQLENNIELYFTLLLRNNDVLYQLDSKTLNKLTKMFPRKMGNYFEKMPSVMLKLKSGIFDDISLSVVFQLSTSKAKMYNKIVKLGILEELYTKFPEFREYFASAFYYKNSTAKPLY